MSSTPEGIKGPIVIAGQLEALPGKGDELAQWFANIRARALSKEEPGTLQYNIVRSGDSFTVFEEYAGIEALAAHGGSPLFVEFLKVADKLWKPPAPVYWPGDSLPEPTVRF